MFFETNLKGSIIIIANRLFFPCEEIELYESKYIKRKWMTQDIRQDLSNHHQGLINWLYYSGFVRVQIT